MKPSYAVYHETLASAVDAAIVYLTLSNVVLADNHIVETYQYDGIPYETKKDAHSEISTYKGKKTHKFAHVSIYRMDSGRYELTVYIL